MKRRNLLSTIAVTSLVSGCLRTTTNSNDQSPEQETSFASQETIDWPQYGLDAQNTAYVQESVGPSEISEIKSGVGGSPDGNIVIYNNELIHEGNKYNLPFESPESDQSDSQQFAGRASHAAVHEDQIFLSGSGEKGRTGYISAFEPDGSEVWKKTLTPVDNDISFPMGSPTVSQETVYQTTGDGIVHALDVSSGDKQWQYNLGGQKQVTPAVSGSKVFVTGRQTVALNEDGDEEWTSSLEFQCSPVVYEDTLFAVGQGLYALDVDTGSTKWSVELGGLDWPGIRNMAIDDAAVYANTDTSIAAVEKSSGEVRFQSEFANSGEVVVSDQRVYAVGKSSGSGAVKAFSKESGEELWSEVFSSPIMTEPVISSNRLYIGAGQGLQVLIG